MPRFLSFPLFLSVLLVGAACQNTKNYKPDPVAELRDKINMSNAAAQTLTVADVKEAVDNGLLRVQVQFDNRAQGRRSFRTLIEWYDARGMKIASANEVWNSHIIRAGQQFTVGGTAISPDARSPAGGPASQRSAR